MTETKKKRPATTKAAKPKQGDKPAMQKNTQSDIVVTEATIADLIPDDKNLNKGTQFGQHLIEKSLRELGAGRSLLLDKNNRIIAGNKTTENAAAIDLNDVIIVESDGTKLVAVKRTDIDLDSERGRKLALADNATSAANLEWDEEQMAALQAKLDNFDPVEWGVEFETQDNKDYHAEEDDFDENTNQVETRCKAGDIWQLGEHRLMCGDSTDAGSVDLLMNGAKADISFQSPPYNAGFGKNITKDNGRSKYTNGDNDNHSQSEYHDFLCKFIDNALKFSQYSFVNIQMLANNKQAFIATLYDRLDRLADIMCWDKTRSQPQLAENVLNSEFEFVLVFSEKANRNIGTIPFHGTQKNIIHISPTKNEYAKEHNAVFPIELPSHFISSFAKQSVLDLFGGSGTTMIAAEQLGRKCYMMELDPHYCDIIIARWEKLTNGKAQKIN